MTSIQKSITVEERHQEFIENYSINLSALVRQTLEHFIEQHNWQSTEEILQEMEEKDMPENKTGFKD